MYRAPTRTLSATSPAIPEHLGEPVLQALRLEGREGINSLFDYRLHLRTLADFRAIAHGTAAWDLDSFIGQPVCCRIEIDGSDPLSSSDGYARSSFGAGVREINGIVSAAELWGDDGEQAEYRLTLRPALFQATLTTDCRIFQNLRIGEILDQVLRRHPGAVEWQLSRELPLRDCQTQYNETDFAFFERLCQEWGINYYFRHAGGRHTLVLTDLGGFGPFPAPAYQRIAFRAPGRKADAEYQSIKANYHEKSWAFYGVGMPTCEIVTWQREEGTASKFGIPRPSIQQILEASGADPSHDERGSDHFKDMQVDQSGSSLLTMHGPKVSRHLHSSPQVQVMPTIHYFLRAMRAADDGDGTVPATSGHAPFNYVQPIFSIRGLSHEPAYNSPDARKVVAYAIARAAANASRSFDTPLKQAQK